MSEGWDARFKAGYDEGYRRGLDDGGEDGYGQGLIDAARQAAKQERILTDLIAELRMLVDQAEGTGWPDDEVFFADSSLVSDAADRAETRLKGLNDE